MKKRITNLLLISCILVVVAGCQTFNQVEQDIIDRANEATAEQTVASEGTSDVCSE